MSDNSSFDEVVERLAALGVDADEQYTVQDEETLHTQGEPDHHGLTHDTKPWHNISHEMNRVELQRSIVELLQARRPGAGPEWVRNLPMMASRLEEALYQDASSFEEYSNRGTLRIRLRQLANRLLADRHCAFTRTGPYMPFASSRIRKRNVASLVTGRCLSVAPTRLLNTSPTVVLTDHRPQVIKQQQQRLLLLRHVSKCQHEEGQCPITPHCGQMKQLWQHIMGCRDQDCVRQHCISSRYVLSHYSKCSSVDCEVCGPVRESIRKHVQRSRHFQMMHPLCLATGADDSAE